jgi:hypothetical protein
MTHFVADESWQQRMHSASGTVLCCYLGTTRSQDVVAYQELLSLLRPLARSVSCELLISTHQRQDGAQEVIIRTALPLAQVSVITARISRRFKGFIVAVKSVTPPPVVTTKKSTSTRSNLRVSHGN